MHLGRWGPSKRWSSALGSPQLYDTRATFSVRLKLTDEVISKRAIRHGVFLYGMLPVSATGVEVSGCGGSPLISRASSIMLYDTCFPFSLHGDDNGVSASPTPGGFPVTYLHGGHQFDRYSPSLWLSGHQPGALIRQRILNTLLYVEMDNR
jgi:hypothetical protein